MTFKTTKKEMALARTHLAQSLLKGSVFDMDNDCAMCAAPKPPGSGPPNTLWIQCDTCERWYHEECLATDEDTLKKARAGHWECVLCI